MIREVRWSKTSRQTYLDILLYIQEKWGDEKAVEFAEKVESLIQNIIKMPLMFPATEHEGKQIRRCVVSKQTSIYYKVEETSIDLITFYDNRQNPENLNFG